MRKNLLITSDFDADLKTLRDFRTVAKFGSFRSKILSYYSKMYENPSKEKVSLTPIKSKHLRYNSEIHKNLLRTSDFDAKPPENLRDFKIVPHKAVLFADLDLSNRNI